MKDTRKKKGSTRESLPRKSGTASSVISRQAVDFGWSRFAVLPERMTDFGKNFRTGCLILILASTCGSSLWAMEGKASWYSSKDACAHNKNPKCPTANGASIYDLESRKEPFGAMWGVPFNTRVRVTNLRTGRWVILPILDRGPAKRLGRIIDLSKSAFSVIEVPKQGIAKVSVEVMK